MNKAPELVLQPQGVILRGVVALHEGGHYMGLLLWR
jgi:hypothetical protein